jgi:AcrR family transcriptional regulator
MKEKEKLILETSIKLFAHKGYKSTSVQEIVNECGISKGAFYLYFQSKEALLLAIFHYYVTQLHQRINDIDTLQLEPREKFEKQLWCQFYEIGQHKNFIIMYMREQTIPFNGEIEQLMIRMQNETAELYQKGLLSLYGERITPFLYDLMTILQGMFQSYLDLIIFNKATIDLHYLPTFILRRMDDMVKGLENSTEKPVLVEYSEKEPICSNENVSKDTFIFKIIEMKNALNIEDYLYITLDVLEQELKMEKPRIPVIQGMTANMREYSQADELRKEITRYFQLNLAE